MTPIRPVRLAATARRVAGKITSTTGHVVALAGVAQHRRAGGVAGDQQELHVALEEEARGVLASVAAHRLGAPVRAVGHARGVAEVLDRLARGGALTHRADDGQAADAAVEDADGRVDLPVRRVLLHVRKARGWPAPMHADATEITRRRTLSAMPLLRTALGAALVAVALVAAPAGASPPVERPAGDVTRVVVISVDGLNPDAIDQLGEAGTPTFHRLMAEGAFTLNARSEVELTITLPNHTGMVTSRRVDKTAGGHGVTWNDDRLVPRTVQAAAGHPVGSVFSVLASAGLRSAMFAAKTKFSLFTRSWPGGIARSVIDEDNTALVKAARRDLANKSRAFTFLHISLPDVAGHAHGWLSPAYLTAVKRSDYLIGRVLTTIGKTAGVERPHARPGHRGPRRPRSQPQRPPTLYADYRVPFFAWGPGVPAGADLYALNPTYADPGTKRVGYAAARQPVRNGDVANLVLDVLGLPADPEERAGLRPGPRGLRPARWLRTQSVG